MGRWHIMMAGSGARMRQSILMAVRRVQLGARAVEQLVDRRRGRVAPPAREQRLHADVATQRAGELGRRAAHAVRRLDEPQRSDAAAGAQRLVPLGEDCHEVVQLSGTS